MAKDATFKGVVEETTNGTTETFALYEIPAEESPYMAPHGAYKIDFAKAGFPAHNERGAENV